MNYDGIERKILEGMSQSLVARKSELIAFMDDKTKNTRGIINMVTKSLVQKGMITPVYASESTFAITQKGMREVNR